MFGKTSVFAALTLLGLVPIAWGRGDIRDHGAWFEEIANYHRLSDRELIEQKVLPFYWDSQSRVEQFAMSNPFLSAAAQCGRQQFDLDVDLDPANTSLGALRKKLLDRVTLALGRFEVKGSLNPIDLELWRRLPSVSGGALYLAYRSVKLMDPWYSLASRNLGDGDAFKHAIWNALMVKYLNENIAIIWATSHEIIGPRQVCDATVDDPRHARPYDCQKRFPDWLKQYGKFDGENADSVMDLLNNEIGRVIGERLRDEPDEVIADYIRRQVALGHLYKLRDGALVPTGDL